MAARIRQVVVVLLLCAFVIPGLRGQATARQNAPSPTTSLTGVVVDKDGGVVPGATVTVKNDTTGAVLTGVSNSAGVYSFPTLTAGTYTVTISLPGFKTVVFKDVRLLAATPGDLGKAVLQIGQLSESVAVKGSTELIRTQSPTITQTVTGEFVETLPRGDRNALSYTIFLPGVQTSGGEQNTGNESYAHIASNRFFLTSEEPRSTFGADVDTASYANVRRFLKNGTLPPADAVRVEELINYFRFTYPQPAGNRPVSVTTEIGECPWAPTHQLALVGVRAKSIDDREVKPRNIVLLIDVSGSMDSPDKLPLVKAGLRMFVDTLRNDDRIAIVVYAGDSGVALPSTTGEDRQRIHTAIENLHAGGSTNGASGIVLAYQVARQHFVPGGVNRVILATDGDFNVGVTSQGDLLQLIQREKETGVFLSVLGVGTGNLKDQTMEMLADKGNGHYSYLDSLQEARRVLVQEGGATLETVAKDVKFQVEFNPAHIAAWRLIGYENRLMPHQDFNNDKKDGGELGAGHTVTVLYEIVPVGALPPGAIPQERPTVDPLRYQPSPAGYDTTPSYMTPPPPAARADAAHRDEIFDVKIRYKQPDGDVSELMEQPVRRGGTAPHVAFASAVAEFGMLLRDPQPNLARWDWLVDRAKALSNGGTGGADRQAFAELVDLAAGLKRIR